MNNLYIVMYHYVRPIAYSEYPNIKGLELDFFREQLRFFMDNFHIVTMEQVIDTIYNQEPIPQHALLLTFDDGYLDHYKYVFPLLKENGVQGSFFVPSGILRYGKVLDVNKIHFILACNNIDIIVGKIYGILDEYRCEGYDIESNEVLYNKLAVANRWDSPEVIFVKRLLQTYLDEEIRAKIVDRLFIESVGVSEEVFSKKLYMNIDQIKEMKEEGMFFGLHGENHYWLNQLPSDKMKTDIKNSLDYFEDIIDKDYIVINYPYGGYNDNVITYARKLGCKLGVTIEAGISDLSIDDPMTLPRFDTNDFPPKSNKWREYISLL